MSKLRWNRESQEDTKSGDGGNTPLETEDGGRDRRGDSIREFVRGLWDAEAVRGKVEGILRKRSREDQEAALQRKKERASERNLHIYQLTRHKGHKIIESFLQRIEMDAYSKLRAPYLRDHEKASTDYFLGLQNGRLSVVEDMRRLYMDSIEDHVRGVKSANEQKRE